MREPISQMLLPDETVLFQARVHPVLLVPGLSLLLLASLMTYLFWDIKPLSGPLFSFGEWLDSAPLRYFFMRLNLAVARNPETVRAIILCCIVFSVIELTKEFLVIFFTHLVISDARIILRQGVYNISLVEIDRHRVASVNIYQTYMGRMLDYGNVAIQGFAASIYGLPVLAKPYEISKNIYYKR
jgi:uncharacterized membrane protein YdbT with pleckstrin-like domain